MNIANGSREQTSTPVPQTNSSNVNSAQGPKVVQTAFIHKLYSMLEDPGIQHLISWSERNDSFVMSPSNEFSRVLSQYFKHTNISSFVRQLNMYGFHKVSDVFHTGSPDSAQWEFKHGGGSFKKGDLMGLRDIKRRASRHTLIHRDSFSKPAAALSQPGTPAEIIPDTDQRLTSLEHAYYDMHARLSRTEDQYAAMCQRCHALTEGLDRCQRWMSGLSSAVQAMMPNEAGLYNDLANMQRDIAKQLDYVRGLDAPQDSVANGRSGYYAGGMPMDGPLSPRGFYNDSRRSSMQMPELQHVGLRPPAPPLPSQYTSSSPRRFGSISAAQASPGFSRPPLPVPPQPHPLATVETLPNNMARRHTSADIRDHGWPIPNTNGSPYASGQSSVHWQPSSPQQQTHVGDQAIRDQLASYEINGPGRPSLGGAQHTPPLIPEEPISGLGAGHVSWAMGASKFPRPNFDLHSAPATRRSSMASNVHSLLNPAETAERHDEDEGPNDDRKRKRLQ